MEWSKHYLDIILVPFSICLTTGYHFFLWYNLKNNHPFATTSTLEYIGRRRKWLLNAVENNEKNGMLSVQSMRNSMMTIILVSSLAAILNSSLAAQTNNAYIASQQVHNSALGSSAESTLILKYATASLFLLLSLLFSSMAVGCLTDASFLIHVSDDLSPRQVYSVIYRGYLLATAGNRVFLVTVPLILWMLGPVPMLLSSLVMVWVLYQLDFTGSGFKEDVPKSMEYRSRGVEKIQHKIDVVM